MPGVDGAIYATAVFQNALYVGGYFSMAGDVPASHIAKWDGTSWSVLGSGTNGNVWALTVFDDGSGPALYAGGYFTTAGGVAANSIAKWDGVSWSALGTGIGGPTYPDVLALTAFDDGGGPALYAGGYFTTAGGLPANYIAKWDGARWSAVGSGTNGAVWALKVFDDGSGLALYAGGQFTTAGDSDADYIAKWNGASWSPLGLGMNGAVYALTVFDDGDCSALYAGGSFTTIEGVPTDSIAKWDGSTWSAMGGSRSAQGYQDTILALAVFDDGNGPAIYVGGVYGTGGWSCESGPLFRKWRNGAWSPTGTSLGEPSYGWYEDGVCHYDPTDSVSALAVFDDGRGPALYVGGGFSVAEGVTVNSVAKWNGASWSVLGGGIGGPSYPSVNALTVFDDGNGSALYAGGGFTAIGGIPANYVAKWDGTSWAALGSGVDGPYWPYHPSVMALAVFDDGSGPALYASGRFTTAGGVAARNIAKWDGHSWSALGAGLGEDYDEYVSALAVFNDGGGQALYAGGDFSNYTGVRLENAAKWNGKAWSSAGLGWPVNVLAVYDDGHGPALYAGGEYRPPAGQGPKTIAKRTGTSWSPLGTGLTERGSPMGATVYALAAFDDGSGPALYVAGDFDKAGGVAVNSIAKWNGTSWSAVGSGTNGNVWALTVFDDGSGPALYAGGVLSSGIAKWNGSSWSALGTGLGGPIRLVFALTGFDDGSGPGLYAGGLFSTAGGKVSVNFAKWSCEVGACCDTNGADQGCTDNVTQLSCTGADKIWTTQGNCVDQECHCIPDCYGANCGDDGCGGSCGTCDDDGNPCNGVEICSPNRTCVAGTPLNCNDGNACNGVETCDPASGCRPGTPLDCDDGNFCNGIESCSPLSGCRSGTPLHCDDGNACNGVETCDPASGCVGGTLDERLPLRLDIRPSACPNVVNIHGRYSVQVAIVATPRVAVSEIDVESLTLQRADGLGEPIQPDLGFRHNNVEILDVATPTDGSTCTCNRCGPDGVDDLLIEFPSSQLTRKFALDRLPSGTSVELLLTGSLLDGTLIELSDCILTAGNPRGGAESKHKEK